MDEFEINDVKSAFDYLKSIREEKGYLLSQVSKKAGYHQTTITRMEDGIEIPTLNHFLAYANALGYSIYVVHESGEPCFICEDNTGKDIISNLCIWRKTSNKNNFISLAKVAQDTGISHTTYMRMEKGETIPMMNNFLAYAKSLGFIVLLYSIKEEKLCR